MRARTKPPQHGKVRTGRFRSCTPAARTCQSHNPRSVQLRMGTAGVRARVCGRGKREREVHEVHCLPSGPRRTIVHTPPPAINLPAHAHSHQASMCTPPTDPSSRNYPATIANHPVRPAFTHTNTLSLHPKARHCTVIPHWPPAECSPPHRGDR